MSAPEIFLIRVFHALLSMYSIPLSGDPYQLQDAPQGIILGSIPSTKGGIMAFPLAHIYMFGLGQSLQINLVEQLWLKHWVLCIVICIQCILTHWGWVTHICACKLCHHLVTPVYWGWLYVFVPVRTPPPPPAADSCSRNNFWTTFWISFIFGTIVGPEL